jgi:transcriptional regulator GlxA family with amidase domain
MDRPVSVGILLFTDVEVLDFAGPFEVFSVASRVALRDGDAPLAPFDVLTVGRSGNPVRARHGLTVIPAHSFASCPPFDVLIVPGGVVAEPLADSAVLDWVRDRHDRAHITASVCTGAFILAKAGLLNGLAAATHWEDVGELRATHPEIDVIERVRFVDEGRVLSSAGVSSGIEMSLNLVGDLIGHDAARRTARQMEYAFEPTPREARPGRGASGRDWRHDIRRQTAAYQARIARNESDSRSD